MHPRPENSSLVCSEALLSLALKAAKAGIWQWDKMTNQVFWSEENFRLLGYDPQTTQAKYENWLQAVHPDDREMVSNQITQVIEEAVDLNLEYRVVLADGNVRWLANFGEITYGESGNPTGLIGIQIDITERKQAEIVSTRLNQALELRVQQRTTALQESERRLSTLISNLPGYVYRVNNDPSYTPEFISEGVFLITGYHPNEYLVDRTISCGQEIHPEDATTVWEMVQQAVTHRKPYECEYRIITKLGEQKWVWERGQGVYSEATGDLICLEGFVTDITERKQIEAARRQSEARYRQLAEDMPVLICQFLPDSTLTYVNPTYSQSFNKPIEELLHTKFLDLLPSQEEQRAVQAKYSSLTPDAPVTMYEHPIVRSDGSEGWQQWIDRAFFDEQGRSVSFQSVGLDITDRKRAEAALRDRLAFEHLISTIATNFVNLFLEELDIGMTHTLGQIGEFLGFDRAYIVLWSDPAEGRLLHQWQASHLEPLTLQVQTLLSRPFPRWLEPLAQAKVIEIPEVSQSAAVTASEQLSLEAAGMRSLLAIPLNSGQFLTGYVGFAATQRPKTWSDDIVILLKLVGELFANVLQRQQIETALRQSEARFQALAANIPGVIYRYVFRADGSHALTYVSPGFEDLYGMAPEVGIQNSDRVWQQIHPDDIAELQATMTRAAQTLESWFAEYRIVTPDGVLKWVQGTARPEHQPNGDVVWDGVLIDISERVALTAERQRAETELKAQQARLQVALEATRMGFWEGNLHTNKEWWSPQVEALFGLAPGTFDGDRTTFLQRVHPDDLARVNADWEEAIQTGILRDDYRIILPDQSVRWISTLGKVFYDEAGSPMQVVGVDMDITERKQAEAALARSEAQFRSLIDNLPFEVWAKDREGRVIVQNPRDRLRWGDDLNSITDTSNLSQEMLVAWEEQDRQVWSGELVQVEESDWVGEEWHTYTKIMVPIWDGNQVEAILGVNIDITDRKRAELKILQLNEALEQQNQNLEKLVQERTAELMQRTAQLEASNKELESFSYSVSHDLRAPLRHIHGFVNALQQQLQHYDVLSDPKVIHYLQIIENSSQKMALLIDGLLALSRIGRKPMSYAPVLLRPLVEEAIALVQSSPETVVAAEFVIGELPTVLGDETLLQQVFSNLIGNAVKFSRHHPAPRIEIGSSPAGTIWIKDNGVGFQMEYADKLFGAFQRLHNQSEFEGTGIGLAIVQRIIHRHGGLIWAESQPHQGATFFFNLSNQRET